MLGDTSDGRMCLRPLGLSELRRVVSTSTRSWIRTFGESQSSELIGIVTKKMTNMCMQGQGLFPDRSCDNILTKHAHGSLPCQDVPTLRRQSFTTGAPLFDGNLAPYPVINVVLFDVAMYTPCAESVDYMRCLGL